MFSPPHAAPPALHTVSAKKQWLSQPPHLVLRMMSGSIYSPGVALALAAAAVPCSAAPATSSLGHATYPPVHPQFVICTRRVDHIYGPFYDCVSFFFLLLGTSLT